MAQAKTKGIQISTGVLHIPVTDPYGNESTLSFNPEDTALRRRFFDAGLRVENQLDEFGKKAKEIEEKYPETPANTDDLTEEQRAGVMRMMAETYALEEQACDFCQQVIDDVFGAGTCQKAFGPDKAPHAYGKLIEALMPYFKEVSDEVMDEYLAQKQNRQQRRAKK